MHELEVDASSFPVGQGLRWCNGLGELTDPGDCDAIRRWLAASSRNHPVLDGRDWTRPGWFDEVSVWIEQTLRNVGYGALLSVVQLRAWPSSCVLRVHAERGDCYFKAVPESLRRECVVTDYLSERFPDVLPRVLRAHPERRWFMTAAFPGDPLDAVENPAVWARTAARYGRLQADCAPRVQELLALGCGTRPLEALARTIGSFADATDLPVCEGADALTVPERDRLVALIPALQQRCERLAASRIPPSLEHGDLWPANVLVHRDSCAIIDWEDVAIAHPFLSLAPLQVGLARVTTADILKRVARSYLESFSQYGTQEQLDETLRLAAPLSFIDMAIRYRQQRPSVASQHPWMRDLVPEALRRALAAV